MNLFDRIPPDWKAVLHEEFEKPYMARLTAFLEKETAEHQVFPPEEDVWSALEYTPYDRARVLIVGQDPYHDDGQAHGLAFSVLPGVRVPPSLVNIYKELEADLGVPRARTGYLKPWADQGVLLLNTSLTVRAHKANSHKEKGWETFTDAIIKAVSDKPERVVFVLWGANAKKKLEFIDTTRHVAVLGGHPSPANLAGGFLGTKPFSQVNAALREAGRGEIDWRLG